jgi:hypothetical protein
MTADPAEIARRLSHWQRRAVTQKNPWNEVRCTIHTALILRDMGVIHRQEGVWYLTSTGTQVRAVVEQGGGK